MKRIKSILKKVTKLPKKQLLLVSGLFLLLVVSILGLRLFYTKVLFAQTNSNQVEITQAYVGVTVYGADDDGDNKTDKAVIQYSPLVNVGTSKDIKKYEIKNVKLTDRIKAQKTYITWPKHFKYGQNSNTFFEPMDTKPDYANRKDEGKSHSYTVVDLAGYDDEISKSGGYVGFKYTLYGVGKKIDSEAVLNSNNTYVSGKELQYSGLKKEDIDSPIEFDLIITFSDNTKAIKHFKLSTDFEEIYNQGFSQKENISDYVGKKF